MSPIYYIDYNSSSYSSCLQVVPVVDSADTNAHAKIQPTAVSPLPDTDIEGMEGGENTVSNQEG